MTGTRGGSTGRRFAAARLHRPGAAPQGVLLIADRELLDEDAARPFPDLLADRITARSDRGVDLDVVWDLAPALQAVTRSTDAWRLWRYEVVIVLAQAAGVDGAARWPTARIARIAGRVLPALADASSVLVARLGDPDPVRSSWDGPSVRSIGVPPGPGGAAGVAAAERLAEAVALLLHASADRARDEDGGTASERRSAPQPERERQRAVDRVRKALGGLSPHLERVVLLARNSFDVPFAQVNLLDHGRIRTLAFVGAPGGAGEQPICTIAVQGSGPTIIADTWQDPRLDDNPHVHDAVHPVRFYAAHPIESVDGYRIGTLCVFDLKPHDVTDVDGSVLRDLAQLAEAEISALSTRL